MTKTSIVTLALTSLLLLGSVSETFAWSKSFGGTRDQVRAACQGPGMVLNEWGDTKSTSCTNANNGTAVACNDNGSCTGTGPGPMPRIIGQAVGQVGQVSGAVAEAQPTSLTGGIVVTMLNWNLKGTKKVVDAPMEGPSTTKSTGRSVLSGQGSGGGTGSGHIGNGNGDGTPEVGQLHSSGSGATTGIFQAM